MNKIFLGLILYFIALMSPVHGQTYGKKTLFKSFDKWVVSSNGSELSMKSFVTVQEIITHENIEVKRQTLPNLPKYRYEIYLFSTSAHHGNPSKICVYNTKVFIDDIEVTRRQFPDGFNFLVDTKPTLIYWFETDKELIDVKIRWNDVCFFKE